MTTIYLAGPVANVDDGGRDWRNELIDNNPTADFANPLDEYNAPADNLQIDTNPTTQNQVSPTEIVESDKELLRESDAVLVGYEDVQSVGTPMEVMWAYERGYTISVWLRDDSILSDLSPWYHYHTDFVTSKSNHAVAYLER